MELDLPIFAPLLKGLSTGCHRQFRFEWSANSLMSDVTPSVMSLLKSKNISCPKTDPWGTPDVTGTWPENYPATIICWVLSDRKSLKIQAAVFPWMPYVSSLCISLLWATLSKALLKSMTMASTWPPLMVPWWSSWTNSTSCVSQDRPRLKPCWLLLRMLLSSRWRLI